MHHRNPGARSTAHWLGVWLLMLFGVACGGDATKSETSSAAPSPSMRPQPARELAAALGGEGTVTIELVHVPPGDFEMGEDVPGAFDQKPHRVRITKGFYVGKYPVTVGQFRRFVDETRYRTTAEELGMAFTCTKGKCQPIQGVTWRTPGFPQTDSHPVVAISWEDAGAFLDWARRKTGKPFRLPTEAEWEWAARGPEAMPFPWGREWESSRVDHLDVSARDSGAFPSELTFSDDSDGYPFTAPVGVLDNVSWVGARDMLGNVWEWCSDWYQQRYYESSPTADPAGPFDGTYRVLRGCSWMNPKPLCRSSTRGWFEPLLRATTRGFRVAIDDDAFAGTEVGH